MFSSASRPVGLAVRILFVRLRFLAIPAVAFLLVAFWPVLRNAWDKVTHVATGTGADNGAVSQDTEYFCPMCPGVLSDWPGKCPVCNMALVRRLRGDAVPLPDGVMTRMQLSPYRIQLAGIRTAVIAYQPLVQEIETAGFVEAEDRPPMKAPSPNSAAQVSVQAAVFEKDVPLLKKGRAVAVACDALPGHGLFAGKVRQVVAELSAGVPSFRVRLDVDNPEGELRPGFFVAVHIKVPMQDVEPFRSLPTGKPTLRPGEPRTLYLCPDHPDQPQVQPGRCPVDGKQLEVQPLAENQRLGWWCPMHPKVTADHSGSVCPACGGMKLVPCIVTHGPPGQVLTVPESAVIDTGAKKVVYVEHMPGMFDGVEVVLGPRCGDAYPVVRGLEAGQRVVSAGAFLLDAETRLNPSVATAYFGAARSGVERREPGSVTPARPDGAEIARALGKLSKTDQALAARQRVCPVTGERLGSMGTPQVVTLEGCTVLLCCKACEAALRKDPGKYLSRLSEK